MNNDTGVYSITSPSGKQYIGSAVSFKSRWAVHLSLLRRNTHHSRALQNAYNKYGESALAFEKVALCPITDLIAVEQRLIDARRPELNVCKVAGSRIGTKFTEAQRAACRVRQLGKKVSQVQRAALAVTTAARRRPVRCIDSGAEFQSCHDVERWLRANGYPRAWADSVSRCCKGALKTAYGMKWEYV